MDMHEYLQQKRTSGSRDHQIEVGRDKHCPELKKAWVACETDNFDLAIALTLPHIESPVAFLNTEANTLLGMIYFRSREYSSALTHFRQVVKDRGNSGVWFNVCMAATLSGEIGSGHFAFCHAINAQEASPSLDYLSIPYMRRNYAHALRDCGRFDMALSQIQALRLLYEHFSVTDTTFLFNRQVPPLQETIQIAADVFKYLGESHNWGQWIQDFSNKLDEDGRQYLMSLR